LQFAFLNTILSRCGVEREVTQWPCFWMNLPLQTATSVDGITAEVPASAVPVLVLAG